MQGEKTKQHLKIYNTFYFNTTREAIFKKFEALHLEIIAHTQVYPSVSPLPPTTPKKRKKNERKKNVDVSFMNMRETKEKAPISICSNFFCLIV